MAIRAPDGTNKEQEGRQRRRFSRFFSSDEKGMTWLPAGKTFYTKALLTCLWIIDAAVCHIVRPKDQLLEDQTWIEIGLKQILKDRIIVPLFFCTTYECKQTNPCSILQRKIPIQRYDLLFYRLHNQETNYFIRRSAITKIRFKAASNIGHSLCQIIQLFGFLHVSQRSFRFVELSSD